ncbi:MAG TPA: GntR family transcriptional regulator [Firmicutes bacterium]|nr:GntR family transcriptional regulator [Bacillota bacterium]HBK60300.1 GntR family transcriptional regulator [Bacillota bacterium]
MTAPMASFDLANARTIRELVHETLRQAIFDGELKDGDRLVEKELAQRLGVSRTPVREAIRKLESEGLIEYLPRKYVVVRGITPEMAIEIYAIREALEVAAIPFVIQNITAEETSMLHDLVAQMRRLTAQGSVDELLKVAREFNDTLIASSRMPHLIKLIGTYQEYQATFRRVTLSRELRKPSALQEHEAILQAVDEKDAARAEQLMRQHLRAAREEYLAALG